MMLPLILLGMFFWLTGAVFVSVMVGRVFARRDNVAMPLRHAVESRVRAA